MLPTDASGDRYGSGISRTWEELKSRLRATLQLRQGLAQSLAPVELWVWRRSPFRARHVGRLGVDDDSPRVWRSCFRGCDGRARRSNAERRRPSCRTGTRPLPTRSAPRRGTWCRRRSRMRRMLTAEAGSRNRLRTGPSPGARGHVRRYGRTSVKTRGAGQRRSGRASMQGQRTSHPLCGPGRGFASRRGRRSARSARRGPRGTPDGWSRQSAPPLRGERGIEGCKAILGNPQLGAPGGRGR